jgi:hypothetical protein
MNNIHELENSWEWDMKESYKHVACFISKQYSMLLSFKYILAFVLRYNILQIKIKDNAYWCGMINDVKELMKKNSLMSLGKCGMLPTMNLWRLTEN